MPVCKGPSLYLKSLVKKRHNSKNIALRIKHLVLQLHLVMMSRHSKFGVDILNIFELWATLKFLQDEDNNNDLVITIAQLFL